MSHEEIALEIPPVERSKAEKWALSLFAIAFTLFHVYLAMTSGLPGMSRRVVHFGMGAALTFLLFALKSKRARWLDYGLIVLALVQAYYLFTEVDNLTLRYGLVKDTDLIYGTIALALTLEGARRTLGWGLPVMAIAALAYVMLGQYIPGSAGHAGYDFDRIISQMYLSAEGIFGVPMGASVNYVVIFITFSVFLKYSGAGTAIGELSQAAVGGMRGGAAKLCVVASGLFGTITGSTVANTAAVGGFSIPLMKRSGFSARFAAAVESVSSCGGQIMPPVMGASAFIMAEMLGIPYHKIALAALLPAVAYYAALFLFVHLYATRNGLMGLPAEEVARARKAIWKHLHLFVPLVLVIVLIGVYDMSIDMSALYGILASMVTSWITKESRIGWREVVKCLQESAEVSISVVMAVACAGIVTGVLSLTGLGGKLSSLLIVLGGGSLIGVLFVTMIACLILGAGLPTAPTYILLAVLVAPAITQMGVPILVAHLFIFYFGAIADVSPPLALSVYVASGIAGSNVWDTMMTATRIGFVAFVIPFVFALYPGLVIGTDVPWAGVTESVVRTTLAVIAGVAALEGYLGGVLAWPYRAVMLAVVAAAVAWPGTASMGYSIAAVTAVALIQKLSRGNPFKKEQRP